MFSKLNSSLQTQLLDMYFSEDGQYYNMARYPIGSCDFSLEHYTYDDVDGDTSLDHFSIDHGTKLRIPFLQRAMQFSPETERDFVKMYLGPTLKKDHPDMNILLYDHNKDHVVKWAQTVYSDSDAAQYLWGTAVHWYSGDQFDHLNTTHYLFPD